MLEILIPSGFAETSSRLADMLEEQGVKCQKHFTFKGGPYKEASARVCWGLPGQGDVPELNAKAGQRSKWQELNVLDKAGIPVPKFWLDAPAEADSYPILGRHSSHSEGSDIQLCASKSAAQKVSCAYFTKVVESVTEYRVWVFRDECLGVYERELTHKPTKTGFGRNWATGYGYIRQYSNLPHTAIDYAKQAIKAMGYDFGAVDILKGSNGRYTVLECNSAPGAEGYAQRALFLLGQQVKQWYGDL
jgi:hypothetical protein